VNATREATADELKSKALFYLNRMTEMGVTTVEAKSGYGLNSECELKMLDVINDLADDKESKLRIISTFLGAHAVPKEYAGRTSEYVDLIIDEMLPKAKGKAKFCDIFTEKNVFEIDDSRRLLKAAREAGLELKLHADEIVQLGGAELAAELHATSADHLLHVSDEGIDKMRDAGVVATLLPLTAFALKESFAPARKIIDRGGAVALATDLNPGSCFSGSIPLSIALACIHMNMSVEETITALTLNGAAALGIANETGSLEKGKSGDVIILNFDTYHALPYYVGMNCVKTVIYKGNVVAENN
jgi:imidazolonepropionase